MIAELYPEVFAAVYTPRSFTSRYLKKTMESMASNDSEHWRMRLIELISRLNVSQRKFSDDTGIDPSYVSRLLYPATKKGAKGLGLANMNAIKKAYSLSPGWFELPLGEELPPAAGDDAATPIHGSDPEASDRKRRIEQAIKAMEQMEPHQFDQAVKIIDTIAEHPPTRKNGTSS